MQKVSFGKRVENVRVLLNLSQKELANELNCSQAVISRWEGMNEKPLKKYVRVFYNYCDLNNIKFLGNHATKFGTTQEDWKTGKFIPNEKWKPNEIIPIEKEQDDAINKLCETITNAVDKLDNALSGIIASIDNINGKLYYVDDWFEKSRYYNRLDFNAKNTTKENEEKEND